MKFVDDDDPNETGDKDEEESKPESKKKDHKKEKGGTAKGGGKEGKGKKPVGETPGPKAEKPSALGRTSLGSVAYKLIAVVILALVVIYIRSCWFGSESSSAKPAPRTYRFEIPLLGENTLSDLEYNLRDLPLGAHYDFNGPPTARSHFDDGVVLSIHDDSVVKSGRVRFTGPAGEKVTIIVTLP